MYMCVSTCLCSRLPVWPAPVFPSRGGTAQGSPRGGRGVCEQPPCPPSSCHITIRLWSRTANYVCVWQPHCQGGENETAGKWRIRGGGWGRWTLSLFVWVWKLDMERKIILLQFLLDFTVKRKKIGPLSSHLLTTVFDFSQFKMLLVGYRWNSYWPKAGSRFYLFV